MRIPFIGDQEEGLSVAINNREYLNCYFVPSSNARAQAALVGAPGSDKVATIAGPCRGMHVMNGVLYGVWGYTLYEISTSWTPTSRGAVAGVGRVSMADNGTQLVIVTGYGATGYIYSAGTLNAITDPDFPGAETVDYVDGYFIYSTGTGQWFISIVNDPTDYNALDFATNEKAPDDTLNIVEDHGELFCFGEETTEVWFNSGNADFPFERNGSAQIERGLYARFSAVKDDNTLFFLGDDLVVYRMQGYTPQKVSDEGTDNQLAKLLKNGYRADLQNAYAFSYTDHGHKFYVLTIPNHLTLVYDMATQLWHTRKHWDYETHHSAAYALAYGSHVFGGIDSDLYKWSLDYYDDDGDILKRLFRVSAISVEDRRVRYKEIKFIFDAGNGLTTGQGADPKMVVRWSNDYGRTWNNERQLGIGVAGDYLKRATTRNCGSARYRIIEGYVTDPVPFAITDAYAMVA